MKEMTKIKNLEGLKLMPQISEMSQMSQKQ